MSLNVKTIENARQTGKPYKLTDGNGLYLYIASSGSKTWRANFTVNGKQQTITYGRYPDISLAEARKLHVLRKCETPKDKAPTFENVFEQWLKIKLPSLDNPKHRIQVENTVREHVLPFIGTIPINAIPRTLLVDTVRKLSHIPETASRVAGRIKMVFDYALDAGNLEHHGAADLARVLPKKKKPKPMPSIPPKDAGKLLFDIMTYDETVTKLGLLFVAHTFIRHNELRNMQWSDFRESDRVIVIPEDRMKMGLPHVVPVSDQVLGILNEMKNYSNDTGIIFESPLKRSHCVSENTLLFALYALGYRGRMTVHGFRSLASTVLNEQSPFKGDVIERQLAHQEKDDVRAAYNRAEYLPQRRELMKWWSDWLVAQYTAQCRTQAND